MGGIGSNKEIGSNNRNEGRECQDGRAGETKRPRLHQKARARISEFAISGLERSLLARVIRRVLLQVLFLVLGKILSSKD
jgi:hypothetical protein